MKAGESVTLDLGGIGPAYLTVLSRRDGRVRLRYVSTGKEIELSEEDFVRLLPDQENAAP